MYKGFSPARSRATKQLTRSLVPYYESKHSVQSLRQPRSPLLKAVNQYLRVAVGGTEPMPNHLKLFA